MPVTEVTDGMRVESGRVYVIPPNYGLRISDGLLKLSPRTKGRQHLPIDLFFESLAKERTDQAIGVVLSGIASDGTAGVQAIKAAGGFTFAQDPCTAQYDGMPRSAIASGAIDMVDRPGRDCKRHRGDDAVVWPSSRVSDTEAEPVPARA